MPASWHTLKMWVMTSLYAVACFAGFKKSISKHPLNFIPRNPRNQNHPPPDSEEIGSRSFYLVHMHFFRPGSPQRDGSVADTRMPARPSLNDSRSALSRLRSSSAGPACPSRIPQKSLRPRLNAARPQSPTSSRPPAPAGASLRDRRKAPSADPLWQQYALSHSAAGVVSIQFPGFQY